ncbi:MAG: NADH-quinone oxidoreductase subunit J [Phycisphaerales bacterium]|nr:NADH-quinone oxidoreductase subunit J [Phycisphaerales bacterium]
MNEILSPILLYAACLIGAIGVALALPRRKPGIALIGGLVAIAGVGLGALALFLWAADAELLPSVFFYVFGLLALGSGLRMITHPRPVYSALYFILTIIASSGLYVILSAEFMAFALIIIYAGAIIITYLFVIMLATQAPTEDDEELLSTYDTEARDPLWSAAVGFVILAALTAVMFRGSDALPPVQASAGSHELLAQMPRKIERELRRSGAIRADEQVLTVDGVAQVDWDSRLVSLEGGNLAALPESFVTSNVEELGFNLLADHPMTIEIAGVILLMAMLGATVLARRQVDIEEAAKALQARRLSLREGASDA